MRNIDFHELVVIKPSLTPLSRADHKASGIGGPAPVTNRGTAMLVMRNFGYLGLHSVVHSKSSLARDRLVSFTREMQLRRKEESDCDQYAVAEQLTTGQHAHFIAGWHKGFVAEPTVQGGRNKYETLHSSETESLTTMSQSPLYAQELAPLRLNISSTLRNTTTSTLKSQRVRGHHVSGDDIEPYFHTSFCNELLCHPRLIHHCPKGNILVKVEMREIEWIPKYEAFVAHLPSGGPAVHNPRRGPFLVQGAYSSCSSRCSDPHFLDEFKLRLPLILAGTKDFPWSGRKVSIFFTVYRLSFSPRKKWAKRFRNKKTGKKLDHIAGEIVGESSEEVDSNTNCHLIQLCCGYLPLISNSSLIADGNYDIKMSQIARYPKREVTKRGEMNATTLILSEIPGAEEIGKVDSDDLAGEDGESVASSYYVGDNASATSASGSIALSEITEGSRSKSKLKSSADPICLQVSGDDTMPLCDPW